MNFIKKAYKENQCKARQSRMRGEILGNVRDQSTIRLPKFCISMFTSFYLAGKTKNSKLKTRNEKQIRFSSIFLFSILFLVCLFVCFAFVLFNFVFVMNTNKNTHRPLPCLREICLELISHFTTMTTSLFLVCLFVCLFLLLFCFCFLFLL